MISFILFIFLIYFQKKLQENIKKQKYIKLYNNYKYKNIERKEKYLYSAKNTNVHEDWDNSLLRNIIQHDNRIDENL